MHRLRITVSCALAVLGAAACGAAEGGDSSSPSVPPPRIPSGDPSCDYTLSDYPGDCLAPPEVEPSAGFVAHYGPSDYDDPDEVAEYLVMPGAEPVDCAYSSLGNTEELFYNRYDVHSRPGMHHVILYAMSAHVADGTRDACQMKSTGASLLAVLQGGIEGDVYSYPPSGVVPPENARVATRLAPHQSVAYELHAVNPTDYPLLRENWTIFYSLPPGDVDATAGQLAFNGGLGMHIPPRTRTTITNRCTLDAQTGPVRILDFFGHMHAHGERFTAWVARPDAAGGETRTLIYESYDWSELDLIEFNSVQVNREVTYKGGVSGGISGPLQLFPGDRIDYECEMNNTGDHALTFQARAFDGEMCNLFGSFTPGTYWDCLGY